VRFGRHTALTDAEIGDLERRASREQQMNEERDEDRKGEVQACAFVSVCPPFTITCLSVCLSTCLSAYLLLFLSTYLPSYPLANLFVFSSSRSFLSLLPVFCFMRVLEGEIR
jgi:hypothetical protein